MRNDNGHGKDTEAHARRTLSFFPLSVVSVGGFPFCLGCLLLFSRGFLTQKTRKSGVTPANQTKESPVHELFLGANLKRSLM